MIEPVTWIIVGMAITAISIRALAAVVDAFKGQVRVEVTPGERVEKYRGLSATERLPLTVSAHVIALEARVDALEVEMRNLKAREYR